MGAAAGATPPGEAAVTSPLSPTATAEALACGHAANGLGATANGRLLSNSGKRPCDASNSNGLQMNGTDAMPSEERVQKRLKQEQSPPHAVVQQRSGNPSAASLMESRATCQPQHTQLPVTSCASHAIGGTKNHPGQQPQLQPLPHKQLHLPPQPQQHLQPEVLGAAALQLLAGDGHAGHLGSWEDGDKHVAQQLAQLQQAGAARRKERDAWDVDYDRGKVKKVRSKVHDDNEDGEQVNMFQRAWQENLPSKARKEAMQGGNQGGRRNRRAESGDERQNRGGGGGGRGLGRGRGGFGGRHGFRGRGRGRGGRGGGRGGRRGRF